MRKKTVSNAHKNRFLDAGGGWNSMGMMLQSSPKRKRRKGVTKYINNMHDYTWRERLQT